MTDEGTTNPSLGQIAREKAEEACKEYDLTVQEIKEKYGLLLDVRDREIEELEGKLAKARKATAHADVAPCCEERSDSKILVAEHSPILRDALVGVLQRKFHVLIAVDGWEALTLTADRPDVILTELDLPRVDVVEMLRHAQRIAPNVPVLAMYDAKDQALLGRTASLGVREGLLKPFHIGALVEKIEALAQAGGAQMDGSILVVCPDPDERYALYHLFDPRHQTAIAASAEAAMARSKDHFDVLIVDTATAEYAWQEVVGFFRGRNRYLKILALGDGSNATTAGALKDAGVDSAVLKPYSFYDLLCRVRELLGIPEVDAGIFRYVYRKLA